MKKLLLLGLLLIYAVLSNSQGQWREKEMEVKVFLQDASESSKLHDLHLNGDVYPTGYAIMYVTPGELELLEQSGLSFEVLKKDLNVYFEGFWQNRDAYHTYDEIIQAMNLLTFSYPNICSKYDLGYSVENRLLTALKISDNVNEDENEPEVIFDGGIHGDEIGGPENLIRFAEYLCQSYGTDPDITGLIDDREIWLYIMVNPDGRVNMIRYNSHGVDLNRDWGYMWNGEGSSTGPYSQVETKTLRDCMYDNQFVVHTTYHSGTEFLSYPWSYRPNPCPDQNHIDYLASLYASLSGYPTLPYGQGYNGMYAINGSSKDSYYAIMGSVGWTMEISEDKQPPTSQIQYYYEINLPSMLALIEHSGYGIQGVVTDASTGDPVAAMIQVNDFYPTYADPVIGDYHKYLTAGTYDLTVTANGYEPQVQNNVTVTEEGITTLDFSLQPGGGDYAWRIPICVIPDNNYDDEGSTPACLGAPDGVCYSLGRSGYAVLDMFDMVSDGPGNEIKVYEGDSSPEGFSCYAGTSMDGPWIFLGIGNGTTSFDFNDAGLTEARFIRIVDDGDGSASGNDAGFDLDAVEQLAQPMVVYLLMDYEVDDQAGNNNQRIDPGESFDLLITLRNNGGLAAENTTAYLNYDSTWISVENQHLDFGDLAHGDEMQVSVPMTADASAPLGSIVMMVMNVHANDGDFSQNLMVNITIGSIVEDWESNGFLQFPWVGSGTLPWTITFVNPYEGTYCAKSANISDDMNSVLTVEMDVIGYDDISFYRKVSSEGGFDFLRFYIDGVMQDEWSGLMDWERVSYEVVPGVHTFRWEYIKDEGVSHNMDCGWIDLIRFPSSNLDGSLHALANAFPYEYCEPGESQLGVYVIGGTPPYNFLWSPADSLNNPYAQFPVANPDETTLFSVTVNDNAFASTNSNIGLTVYPKPEAPTVEQAGDSLVSSSEEGNQWYGPEGLIGDQTGQVFYPSEEGEYFVIVTSEWGCISDTSNIVHFLFTGIHEQDERMFRIYPVPVNDYLNISMEDDHPGKYLVELFDMTGRMVHTGSYTINDHQTIKIYTGNLPGGVYVVSLISLENGNKWFYKFVK